MTFTARCRQCALGSRPRQTREQAVEDGAWHEARLPDHHVRIEVAS